MQDGLDLITKALQALMLPLEEYRPWLQLFYKKDGQFVKVCRHAKVANLLKLIHGTDYDNPLIINFEGMYNIVCMLIINPQHIREGTQLCLFVSLSAILVQAIRALKSV